jgi:hypothetical protein
MKRVELGCAGHFICARDCHWRRHTQVGNFRVSSVGDFYSGGKRKTIGSTGYFETMVFKTAGALCEGSEGCGCVEVSSWNEIECVRYETAGEAQAGHEALVKKYMKESA